MKRWVFLGLLLLPAACGKPAEPAPAATSTPKPAVVSTPVAAAAPKVPRTPPAPEPIRPRLLVTANESDVPEIPAGWPLILTVSLHAPWSAPLKIAAASGSWSSLVRLTPPEGAWPLRPVEVRAPQLTLDAASFGVLEWTMSAEELDLLPRGTYRFGARLEAGPSGDGAWSGSVAGSPAVVTLVKAIPRLMPGQDLERSRLLVKESLLRGDAAAAEREADALLKRQPKQPRAVLLRAEVLESAGRRAEAIALLDRAIAAAAGPAPTAKTWPRDLVRRRDELASREKQ